MQYSLPGLTEPFGGWIPVSSKKLASKGPGGGDRRGQFTPSTPPSQTGLGFPVGRGSTGTSPVHLGYTRGYEAFSNRLLGYLASAYPKRLSGPGLQRLEAVRHGPILDNQFVVV